MKKEKGITLIALIITIIVMLILVGVSVTVALNGGLFTKAKEAAQGTKTESEKEQLLEIAMGTLREDGTVNLTALRERLRDKYEVTGDAENGYLCENKNTGKKYTISEYGIVSDKAYVIGEEVTVKDREQVAHNFYVIADNGDTVTLLAKQNTSGDQPFCSPSVWSSANVKSEDDLNLNPFIKADETSAVYKAIEYGNKFTGATGRLMTFSEASKLASSYPNITYGPTGARLNYWLGTGSSGGDAYSTWDGTFFPYGINASKNFGVRPIIVISKSSIS